MFNYLFSVEKLSELVNTLKGITTIRGVGFVELKFIDNYANLLANEIEIMYRTDYINDIASVCRTALIDSLYVSPDEPSEYIENFFMQFDYCLNDRFLTTLVFNINKERIKQIILDFLSNVRHSIDMFVKCDKVISRMDCIAIVESPENMGLVTEINGNLLSTIIPNKSIGIIYDVTDNILKVLYVGEINENS